MFSRAFLVILLLPFTVDSIRGALFRSGRSPTLQKTRDSRSVKVFYNNLFRPDSGPLLSPQTTHNNLIDNEQILSRLRSFFTPFNVEF